MNGWDKLHKLGLHVLKKNSDVFGSFNISVSLGDVICNELFLL